MKIKVKKNKHLVFYALLTLLLLLLLVGYTFQLNIPQSVLTGIIIIIALLGSQNEILAISLCCIPLHSTVDFYLAIGVCAIIYVLKNSQKIKIGNAVILGLLMVSWETAHCFVFDFDLKTLFGSLIILIYLTIILSSDIGNVDYVFIVKTIAIASLYICIMLMARCFVQAGFNFTVTMADLQRLGSLSENSTASINPNTLGIINVLSICGLLQLWFIENGSIKNIIMIFLLLILGFLTASRTFFVCLLIMIFMFIVGQPGKIMGKIRSVVLMAVLGIVAVLFYKSLFPYNFEFFISRFQTDNIASGRDSLLLDYHEFITSNAWVSFFGVGVCDFATKVIDVYNVSNGVPHNIVQEIIVAWGVPGFIMFLLLFALMIMKSNEYNKKKIVINYIPLAIILSKSMVGQFLTSGYTMLALVLAYLSLCQNFKRGKLERNQGYNSASSKRRRIIKFSFRKG